LQLRAWHVRLRETIGPTATIRGIFDRVAEPLFALLGYRVVLAGAVDSGCYAVLEVANHPCAALFVTGWGRAAGVSWRDVVHHGIATQLRWCLCVNGPQIRVVDATRTYSRRFLEFDLEATLDHEPTFAAFWGLLRANAMQRGRPGVARSVVLERALELTEQHRASVRSSLQHGVHGAVEQLTKALFTAGRRPANRAGSRVAADQQVDAFDEALVVVYRILFLLFAEARGLVPKWHPIYRDGYTIESLRHTVEMWQRPPGVWEALQAIARLAHHGCRVGSLRVPPWNGRLFSPAHAPLADRVPIDDGVVRGALLALTTRKSRGGLERIAYGDLGVEQLGGVYERLLDFDRAVDGTSVRLVRSQRRRSTGAFYTPRALTEYLVRRALSPLGATASPEAILNLRIVDPAMGSGAFLVAACRYLATAYERALVREGEVTHEELTEQDRATFRRLVAQRCLYGVDINPMAVQLGRLSLWLATLSADRPLTFLDHRLQAGNSLVGATTLDIATRRPGGQPVRPLPLFDDAERDAAMQRAVSIRQRIASEPGDTLAQVREKERALASLRAEDSDVQRWKAVHDLWCSAWYSDAKRGHSALFGALADHILGREALPDGVVSPALDTARAIASRERFFHWHLEFPEVFAETGADPLGRGFDAVIGNPPWEMLRGDRGDSADRTAAKASARRLMTFARGSGIYSAQGLGHGNLYLMFLERALGLLRPGGRLGLVLPSGLATDQGAAPLRRTLFDRTAVDSFVSLENRDGVFPVHRSIKFLLLTATNQSSTMELPCRFGIRAPEVLDEIPESGADRQVVAIARPLVEKITGDELAIPEIRSTHDMEIVRSIAYSIPTLGDPSGWSIHFGRELNATDDRRLFGTNGEGLPVVEGKHVHPFVVDLAASPRRIAAADARTRLDEERTFGHDRVGYREVASSSNRLTLIAAMIPRGVVTTHSIFCVKDPLPHDTQWFLCGMLNSFVANYLVRMRVGTHVTAAIIDRLAVPRFWPEAPRCREIAATSEALSTIAAAESHAELQALAAIEYGLNAAQFRHVLETLPLVPKAARDAAFARFCAIVS
jgi:hypothetical protein